jgi:GrpB-like predicted nucleotidyltransferase (UPF0157 family)
MLSRHDPSWSAEFAALKAVLGAALGGLALDIEHVGSTAVPDLLAKPILDIDVVMRDYSVFPDIVRVLRALGYNHEGDQGIFEREAFRAKGSAPNVPRASGWMHHHLYVCPVHSRELQRHLRFRDALRLHEPLRREYEAAKQSIAARAGGDRRRYAEIKAHECAELIERALTMPVPPPA